jgi:hypothetical protein
MDRLVEHQNKLENFLNNYYEVLDKMRRMILETEYTLHQKIKKYEVDLQSLLNWTQNLKTVDYYFEQKRIEIEISKLIKNLDTFNLYIPQYDLLAQKTPYKQMQYEDEIRNEF